MSDASGRSRDLIRRAPSGYLWNQAFSLWLFLSLFLYQLVITRALSVGEKGVYELVLTPANVAVYLAALGLESAGSVYLPRALADGGPARAAAVALRLLVVRLGAVLLVTCGILWGLPALRALAALLDLPQLSGFVQSLGDPVLLAHRGALALYVVGVGLANLLAALLTALLRTRLVFVVGSLAQLLTVGLGILLVGTFHAGANGALTALALPNLAMALAYGVGILRVLGAAPARVGDRVTGAMLRLGMAAWLADLANGSLIKFLALTQLSAAVSHEQIAFFGLAFEMGHAASFLFVAGLGGVGLAVMSAAYVNRHLSDLAVAWRSVSKLQVLLAVPLVAFCVPHADAIIQVLYGRRYADVGALLALFLALNALIRLGGGGAHEAALYVLGHQRWVVLTRWASLGILALGDVLLIPLFGVAGALLAVGLAQVGAELAQLLAARAVLARAYPIGFLLKVLLALAPGLAFATLWRPSSLLGLTLSGVGYTAIFLLCLRIVRPLDAEDTALLQHVPPRLRALLLPFTASPRQGEASPPTELASVAAGQVTRQPVPSRPVTRDRRPDGE
jgi:O-antigen/teichoic acid export membrane protein